MFIGIFAHLSVLMTQCKNNLHPLHNIVREEIPISLNHFEIYCLEKITNNFLIGIFDIKNYGTIFKKS